MRDARPRLEPDQLFLRLVEADLLDAHARAPQFGLDVICSRNSLPRVVAAFLIVARWYARDVGLERLVVLPVDFRVGR